MKIKKVKLTVERTDAGLRATIFQRKDPATRVGERAEAFLVESVPAAKKRASAVARQHGLSTYAFVDKTGAKAKAEV
jgi:hypothetical protein